MLKTFSQQKIHFWLVCLLVALCSASANAQATVVAQANSGEGHGILREASETKRAPEVGPGTRKPATTEEKLDALTQIV